MDRTDTITEAKVILRAASKAQKKWAFDWAEYHLFQLKKLMNKQVTSNFSEPPANFHPRKGVL